MSSILRNIIDLRFVISYRGRLFLAQQPATKGLEHLTRESGRLCFCWINRLWAYEHLPNWHVKLFFHGMWFWRCSRRVETTTYWELIAKQTNYSSWLCMVIKTWPPLQRIDVNRLKAWNYICNNVAFCLNKKWKMYCFQQPCYHTVNRQSAAVQPIKTPLITFGHEIVSCVQFWFYSV